MASPKSWLLLGAGLATSIAFPAEAASPRFQLENGLTVRLVSRPGSPTVSVALGYPVGSRHDPRTYAGLAHLAEHIAYDVDLPDHKTSTRAALDQAGAIFSNAYTHQDFTSFVSEVPKPAWRTAVWVQAQRMALAARHASEAQLKLQKSILHREDEYGTHAWRADRIYAQLFPEDRAYLAPSRSPGQFEGIEMEGLQGFLQHHYQPDRAVLVVVGDLDLDTLSAEVQAQFGAIPRGGFPPAKPGVAYLSKPECAALSQRVPGFQSKMQLAWRWPAGADLGRLNLAAAMLELVVLEPARQSGEVERYQSHVSFTPLGSVLSLELEATHAGSLQALSDQLNQQQAQLAAAAALSLLPRARARALAQVQAARENPVYESLHWLQAELTTAEDLDWVQRRIMSITQAEVTADLRALASGPAMVTLKVRAEGAGPSTWGDERDRVDCISL